LTPLQTAAIALNKLILEQTTKIESHSTQPLPKGLGKLTEQLINRELCDPKRFNNRRQVSSYLGLCPGEHSSGARQQRASITKTGNPRLSHVSPSVNHGTAPGEDSCRYIFKHSVRTSRQNISFNSVSLACLLAKT
jgi:hypothetical protein